MLEVKNLYAGYDGEDVLKNLSFNITGNISIVGPNGCGKSTLLKVIANILKFKGEINIFGKPFSSMKQKEISLNIAMLSQQPSIYFDYSVLDTVMMGRYLHIKGRFSSSPSLEDKEVVLKSLKAVNLLDEKNKSILALSGGQLQRVFLARALAQEPRIILLDEPTNHLDLKNQVELIEYIKEWAKEGERAIVGVLHDINLAMRLSDQLIVMNNGEIVENGNIYEIIKSGLLNKVYGMDVKNFMITSLEKWSK